MFWASSASLHNQNCLPLEESDEDDQYDSVHGSNDNDDDSDDDYDLNDDDEYDDMMADMRLLMYWFSIVSFLDWGVLVTFKWR